MEVSELKAICSGRWYGILTNLGISEDFLTKKHGPCPMCQNGVDRFRWIDEGGSGNWFCNQCSPQAGDSIALIQKVLGWSFPETIQRISEIVGGCRKMETEKKIDIAKVKEMLNKIFKDSVPLTGSDPASTYLHSRKLVLRPENVRYVPELYHSDTKLHYPAMIAKFVSKDGTPLCLHRTYLSRDAVGKAEIESNKKFTPTIQPMPGGAVRLFSPDNEMFEKDVLGIGEGLESSMAAAQIYNIATWAALSNILLESWEPPDNIRKIVIFSDNDASFVGQKSAYILANKLYKKDLIVSVEMPTEQGQDFCDILLEMQK